MTRHQTHRATLFALVAAFGVTAAGMAISTREHAVVLPTLTDVTPATFTEGATVVGVDGDYLIVTDSRRSSRCTAPASTPPCRRK